MVTPLRKYCGDSFVECGADPLKSACELRIFTACSDNPVLRKLPKEFKLKDVLSESKHSGLEDLAEVATGYDKLSDSGLKWKAFSMNREDCLQGSRIRGVSLVRNFEPDNIFQQERKDFYMLAFNPEGDNVFDTSYKAGEAVRTFCIAGLDCSHLSSCRTCAHS